MAHKDICIGFEFKGRKYEAVGFLNDGQKWVMGNTMLARVPGAIGEEDFAYLWGSAGDSLPKEPNFLPKELNLYTLATARRLPGEQPSVSYLLRLGESWFKGCNKLKSHWGSECLVLRRCK